MIYFSSDHHFGHNNIIKYCNRPFSSVDEMNKIMIDNWNSIVSSNDIVYYLGDFSLSYNVLMEILPILNGEKHLIAGNHDKCHPANNNKTKSFQSYIDYGFSSVKLHDTIVIGNEIVNMHHMPYYQNKDDKYSKYKIINDNKWLLHGHIHNNYVSHKKMINVGVDVWDFKLVSLEKIEDIIKK